LTNDTKDNIHYGDRGQTNNRIKIAKKKQTKKFSFKGLSNAKLV